MHSIVQTRGHVSFPAFTGERVYMRPFYKAHGLPADLKRWQPTVDSMLEGVDTNGPLYLMIDQKIVVPGNTQRRPGLHIDGYWIPASLRHGQGHGTVQAGPGDWKQDDWLTKIGFHKTGHLTKAGAGGWAPEALLLASDVVGCDAMEGEWDGQIGKGGDCSHLDLMLKRMTLAAGRVHAVNVTGLHQSIPLPNGGPRTLVRINVPGWSSELDMA